MALRLQKPWLSSAEALRQVRGQMGVYQLANEAGEVIFVSYAGGRSLGVAWRNQSQFDRAG